MSFLPIIGLSNALRNNHLSHPTAKEKPSQAKASKPISLSDLFKLSEIIKFIFSLFEKVNSTLKDMAARITEAIIRATTAVEKTTEKIARSRFGTKNTEAPKHQRESLERSSNSDFAQTVCKSIEDYMSQHQDFYDKQNFDRNEITDIKYYYNAAILAQGKLVNGGEKPNPKLSNLTKTLYNWIKKNELNESLRQH